MGLVMGIITINTSKNPGFYLKRGYQFLLMETMTLDNLGIDAYARDEIVFPSSISLFLLERFLRSYVPSSFFSFRSNYHISMVHQIQPGPGRGDMAKRKKLNEIG